MNERPHDETLRLARLHALQIPDTPPEQQFDNLTKAAAEACGTPVPMLNFFDEERQWSKAIVGLPTGPDMARCDTICTHVVDGAGLLEVTDLALDARFRDFPIVVGSPGMRFYAGVPLAMRRFRIGRLLVRLLKTLPVDFIKIDGHFIKDIDQDPLDAATVRCFREVAGSIDVKTIAERIEHAEQHQALVDLGIDFGQGYLMHQPEPLDQAMRRVTPALVPS